jgi:tRNA(Ile)-lysidine synthetase-like protein
MVLLDLCARAAAQRSYELIVAHFDHGLRSDSAADAQFVAAAAQRYGIAFECHAAHLSTANEATARAARHAWFQHIRRQHQAAAILTAHHQDDLLETSLLNLARGSGRRGLAPMQAADAILRPLLAVSRAQLRAYAAAHHIAWHEDSTNTNLSNPRNFLRHRLLPASTLAWRTTYLGLIAEITTLNSAIDQNLTSYLLPALQPNGDYQFPKTTFRTLSLPVAAELIAAAARTIRPGLQLDAAVIQSAASLAITGHTGKQRPLRGGLILAISRSHICLITKSPV